MNKISSIFLSITLILIANDDTSNIVQEKVNGELYTAICQNQEKISILNSKNENIFTKNIDCTFINFEDFNKDGYKDLTANTTTTQNLIVYSPKTKKFNFIEDFSNFPNATNIDKTNKYYSYHRSGCADMLWDSDLFYIKDNKAIQLGNIHGDECELNTISINKSDNQKDMKIISTQILEKYKNGKFGFIDSYWKEHNKEF
ncbi:hypothetical protein BN3087_390053 [Sulfurovum sp. enrichment culture clone C5]|uniref:Uncharacterized protein n=1 Tax=Sulfurovum sp. enrichment culture clone C5 TaxID=497650 RepID=A0A0S4XMR2_9BACT|nr:hypothetical protein BN3087_390053 [Sulfurovum sp. enrichment culture clone C5]